ncbi:MAG: hypothetical protein ACK55R_05005 [Cyanobacteriota bacterium]
MSNLLTVLYLTCFAVIAGGSFALMTQSLRLSGAMDGRPSRRAGSRRHPEAPQPGEEVLVIDLTRERLEELYRQAS